jgi:hypothetical protein
MSPAFLIASIVAGAHPAAAHDEALEVPPVVAISALLEEDGVPLDRPISARFAFWDAPIGGALVWSETHAPLLVSAGVLFVELGARVENPLTAGHFAGARFLEIVIEGVPLSPRARLASAPFALVAATAQVCGSLDGLSAEDVASLAALAAPEGAAGGPLVSWRNVAVPERVRVLADSEELPVFQQHEACEASRSLTTLPHCPTSGCADGTRRRCDGSCGGSAVLCENALVGFLRAP